MKAGLLDVEDIVAEYFRLPELLLLWINTNKATIERDILKKVLSILHQISEVSNIKIYVFLTIF